ncbi:MAG: hypothetical protein E7240_08940 [Lachnospiraceae bacterium]|nr:hypothetical protein [Lachnospiraceae bacterium]
MSLYEKDAEKQVDEMLTLPCEKETLTPEYYLKCTGFWPVFREVGSFSYGTTEVCTYTEKLDADNAEDGEREAEERNAAGFICPVCKKKGRLTCVTNFELFNENRIMKGIQRSALHMG